MKNILISIGVISICIISVNCIPCTYKCKDMYGSIYGENVSSNVIDDICYCLRLDTQKYIKCSKRLCRKYCRDLLYPYNDRKFASFCHRGYECRCIV